MPAALTTASTVLCGVLVPAKAHGGTVALASAATLRVTGAPALLASSLGAIGACQNVPPPPGATPCLAVISLTSGVSVKLLVGGMGVLLDTLHGTTGGLPVGTLVAVASQTKLMVAG